LKAKPYAFISKPFRKAELVRTIKLTVERIESDQDNNQENNLKQGEDEHYAMMEDRLFVRHKGKMVKVEMDDILYTQADSNYTHIFTINEKYIVSINSKNLEAQLPENKFVRVHRSYIVNLIKIDSISEYHEYLNINDIQIPISRRMKQDVVKRLKLI